MLAMSVDTTDWDKKLRQLAETPDLIRKAVVGALSDTVDDLDKRQKFEMKRVFNNPKPYVLGGLKKVYPGGKRGDIAKAGTFFAYFPVGKSPEDIVKPHVFGGSRRQKRNEQRLNQIGLNRGGFTIMGNEYPKDASGDIPGARYTQMLHQIGALSDMARQALPKSKQKDRKGTSYYVIKRGGVPIAIGERTGASTRIMLVFARNVQYRKNVKYDYFDIGKNQVEWSLPLHFNRIINRYISRM